MEQRWGISLQHSCGWDRGNYIVVDDQVQMCRNCSCVLDLRSRLPGVQVRSATREGETRGSELLERGGRPVALPKMEDHDLKQHRGHAMNQLSSCEPRLSLGDFNEGALLHNVRQRYFDDLIYTGIGSAVLTACGRANEWVLCPGQPHLPVCHT